MRRTVPGSVPAGTSCTAPSQSRPIAESSANVSCESSRKCVRTRVGDFTTRFAGASQALWTPVQRRGHQSRS